MKSGYLQSVRRSFLALASLAIATPAIPALELGSPFSSHMVLQQQMPVPVWGWAEPGENVTVEFAGQSKSVRAGKDRRWEVRLDPLAASAESRAMVVRGEHNTGPVRIDDVVVGEVWICGGQSNMERLLGARGGQPIKGRAEAVAQADLPLIRQLMVAHGFSLQPSATAKANWTVCSPATAEGFTAVGFFFARDLFRAKRVPVGIINSSYGGSAADAWISQDVTAKFPDIQARLAVAQAEPKDYAEAQKFFFNNLEQWFKAYDPGTKAGWQSRTQNTSDWETMDLPNIWEKAGHPAVDGVGWFQKRFELPRDWNGHDLELRLGVVDDGDTTWVNGTQVGSTYVYGEARHYTIPASLLTAGENIITVRVLDFANDGGFLESREALSIEPVGQPGAALSLRGPWRCRFSLRSIEDVPIPPQEPTRFGIWVPGNLYNAMIAPLVPYAIRGFTFYQGETNTGHAKEYQKLFPALIADWRRAWGEGEIPFLFVQIAPYRSSRAEFREAQAISWRNTKNTAMVVLNDCTDGEDIHPPDKQPVGARLALAARALAYGEKLEYSGPVFKRAVPDAGRLVLSFDHPGGGLVAKDGALRGFVVAGRDGVFYPAHAEISGDTVVVSSPEVSDPAAARYGWENVPDGNLFNRAGLPASSFRTDEPKP
jgi:sialate O-acetylesterase